MTKGKGDGMLDPPPLWTTNVPVLPSAADVTQVLAIP